MAPSTVKPQFWKSKLAKAMLFAVLSCSLLYVGMAWLLMNPSLPRASFTNTLKADVNRLEADVRYLASLTPSRNARNVASLNKAATYIEDAFAKTGCRLGRQTFQVDRTEYRNIVCSFGPETAPRVVIGGHYDVIYHNNPGADDNASGVAGILELARLISTKNPRLGHRLDLVAFTLEEPPHFRTSNMGSHVYARNLINDEAKLKIMISVEMIGFFSDEPNSQDYPLGILKWFYPSTANFIAVVGRTFDRSLVARVKRLMSATGDLPVYSINAPAIVSGIDFSDHLSFWKLGLPAVMVTDTAFLRNQNYHKPTDTIQTLDYRRMAKTVDGLYHVAVNY